MAESRMISDDDKKYLLSIKPEDLTFDLLLDLFGDTAHPTAKHGEIRIKKSKFNMQDAFYLYPKNYFNSGKILTTVGKFIYNKYIVEFIGLQDIIGYVNWELTDSGNSKVEGILSDALLNNKINRKQFGLYIDRRDTLGEQLHAVITSSFSMNILKTPEAVKREKTRLLAENKEKLDNGDLLAAVEIEKTLLKMAESELKDDPGMDLYNSGARGSFNNNYKNINIMKGPVFNSVTGKYDIVQSSFMDGIQKQDIPSFGNSIISGAFPKAVGTQVSGYFAKQILAALQSEVINHEIDENGNQILIPGSDCGTKGYLDFTITEKNMRDFYYRYIIESGKLIELTPDVIKLYVNQRVKLRSPMYCIGIDGMHCNHCIGNLFHMLEVVNVGTTSSRVATTLTKLSMKKFHDSTAKVQQVDLNTILI